MSEPKIEKHSPTPWKVELAETFGGDLVADNIVDSKGENVTGVWTTADADAHYIVRCVNSHEALLAALKGLVARAQKELADPEDCREVQYALEVLSLAEAGDR